MLGIVSRTDVLRTLHGESFPTRNSRIYLPETEPRDSDSLGKDGKSIRQTMLEVLPPRILNILSQVYQLATHWDHKVFVVGGFVRDLLLGVENTDVDLVP
ncbi:MAG TPA: hypothetical protein VHS59_07605 [Bacillota bacterium]|nr:hypothetical protein [Bacillota bacterium]